MARSAGRLSLHIAWWGKPCLHHEVLCQERPKAPDGDGLRRYEWEEATPELEPDLSLFAAGEGEGYEEEGGLAPVEMRVPRVAELWEPEKEDEDEGILAGVFKSLR